MASLAAAFVKNDDQGNTQVIQAELGPEGPRRRGGGADAGRRRLGAGNAGAAGIGARRRNGGFHSEMSEYPINRQWRLKELPVLSWAVERARYKEDSGLQCWCAEYECLSIISMQPGSATCTVEYKAHPLAGRPTRHIK